ncbi:hypothetical protein K435DRAFT_858282 [Dendrothele bispora CBS 962.96]|uniref:PHD-type domain-containing protein n=1 Tax=Dendrothele bispora (strain CBS 962.96) TaxID=1314807 RepID=A0A4S8M3K5_DENBC|nr:hypothetical protein K435DRAFT_858282 [Dendrothele bispora CBS 962.96]
MEDTLYARSVIPINGRAVVFDYDGMKHDGYSQRQAAKVDTLLAGHSPPCPSGYYTHAVIYHLKGEARKYFDIVPGNTSDDISRLSKSGFVELPDVAVAMWKDRPGREYELVEDDLENDLKKVDEKLSMPPIQTLDAISAPESTDMEIDHLGLEYNAVLTSEPETVKSKDSPLMLHDDSIISSSPPPSTPIQMLCRCGVESDGHRESIDQTAVQCEECQKWSHLACLTLRPRNEISRRWTFICHICKPPKINPPELAVFKDSVLPNLLKTQKPNMADRFVPGRGALIKMTPKDKFFYPARLISKSKEKWTEFPPHAWLMVYGKMQKDVEKQYWENLQGVMKFMKKESAENYLEDWKQHPFDTEIARALKPHYQVLEQLAQAQQSAEIPISDAPVLSLFQSNSQKKPEGQVSDSKAKVPAAAYFCGGLTLDDQARILNWIYTKFPDFNPLTGIKMNFLKNQSQTDQETPLDQHYVLQKAWQRLVEFTGKTVDGKSKPRAADVDYEAVNILEEIMFDRTHEAGIAGNCQWGLDVAPLEDDWFPYNGPESQHNNLRDGTESELETGPDYHANVQIEATTDPGNEKRAPRPRPRLKRKIDKVENIEYGTKKKRK